VRKRDVRNQAEEIGRIIVEDLDGDACHRTASSTHLSDSNLVVGWVERVGWVGEIGVCLKASAGRSDGDPVFPQPEVLTRLVHIGSPHVSTSPIRLYLDKARYRQFER